MSEEERLALAVWIVDKGVATRQATIERLRASIAEDRERQARTQKAIVANQEAIRMLRASMGEIEAE